MRPGRKGLASFSFSTCLFCGGIILIDCNEAEVSLFTACSTMGPTGAALLADIEPFEPPILAVTPFPAGPNRLKREPEPAILAGIADCPTIAANQPIASNPNNAAV